jgi:serine/threonine-protein kinase RIO1
MIKRGLTLLQHDLIHGDLSAYNLLYWEGSISLIDFPQVVNLHTNPKARFILRRDVQRTCEYFVRQGVDCDAEAIAGELWRRYVPELHPEDRAADESRLEAMLAGLVSHAEFGPVSD